MLIKCLIFVLFEDNFLFMVKETRKKKKRKKKKKKKERKSEEHCSWFMGKEDLENACYGHELQIQERDRSGEAKGKK